jgi:hypothetical protein
LRVNTTHDAMGHSSVQRTSYWNIAHNASVMPSAFCSPWKIW